MDVLRARWRTPAPLGWRRWDDADEWVVFNPASGDLHLVNEPTARVLGFLERAPATVDELAAGLADAALDTATLAALIASLDTLGLVEPVWR